MTQITEDYVSYETAKLLKEKGFRAVTNRYYNAQYDQIRTVSDSFMMDWNDEKYMKSITMPGAIAIPTYQMALKWLREVHNLHITIKPYITEDGIMYLFEIYKLEAEKFTLIKTKTGFEKSELANEAALKYALENLI